MRLLLQRLHRLQITLEDFRRAVAVAGLQTCAHELHHGDTYTYQVPMLSERNIGG
jgi:hypothetical protein